MIGKAAGRVQVGYKLSKRSLRSIASELATRNFAFGRTLPLRSLAAEPPQSTYCGPT